MYGVIAPRANMLTAMSGGTSFDALTSQLREAVANPKVSTIVLDVDSPGGSVAGATEFAAEVRAAVKKKPVLAVAEYQMASAAYWASAGATRIYAAPSAMVGSVGVYTIHNEISKALAALGVTRTYISAGPQKVDGNEVTPLSADVLARIQAAVDTSYESFLGDISKGRSTPLATVRAGYGQGRAVQSDEALALGMIDGIKTLDAVLALALAGDPEFVPHTSAAALQEPSPVTSDRFVTDRQALACALLTL